MAFLMEYLMPEAVLYCLSSSLPFGRYALYAIKVIFVGSTFFAIASAKSLDAPERMSELMSF